MDRIGLICRYIKEDPRSTQRDLAQKTGFSVGTVNTLIKEAMQQRLIAQGKSVAGTYELTGAGDAFLEQFQVDGALYIKQYQSDGLHSLNKRFKIMRRKSYDEIKTIGRVIGILPDSDFATSAEIQDFQAQESQN